MTEDPNQDIRITDELLSALPTVPVPPALEARILADFDRIAARRAPGALARLVSRWRDNLWPGAPVWKPASVLALSLAVGLVAGVLMPSSATVATGNGTQSEQQIAADAPPIVNMTGDL